MRDYLTEKGFAYDLYADPALVAARAFGLAFRLPAETYERYKGFGVDLEQRSGETHRALPVPAVFLVDGEGTITFSYVNPTYQIRLAPEVLLAAARAQAERESD